MCVVLMQLEWNILGAPVPPNFLQTRCTRNRYSPYPLPPYPLPLPPLKVPRNGETPVFESTCLIMCHVQPPHGHVLPVSAVGSGREYQWVSAAEVCMWEG